MRVRGDRGSGRTEEGDDVEPGHVESGEEGGEGADPEEEGMLVVGEGQDQILAVKTGQQGAANEGKEADAEGPGGERDFFEEAAHFPNVLFLVQGVDDGPGGEEEEGLEESVGGEVEHGGGGTVAADGHDHVAELGEGRVGEDAFDVVLLDGNERGADRSQATDEGDEVHAEVGENEERVDPAKHVDRRQRPWWRHG